MKMAAVNLRCKLSVLIMLLKVALRHYVKKKRKKKTSVKSKEKKVFGKEN